MQYHVARALAESASLGEAAPVVLRSICESLGWAVGGLWLVEAATDQVRLVDFWCSGSVAAQAVPFVAASRQLVFTRGDGTLPGRVLGSGRPAWIVDVVHDPAFARAELAAAAGLRSAFAFPIRLNDAVLGVFDFFATRSLQPDELLLKVMDGVGAQIGQFDERRRAEAALARKVNELQCAHERLASQHNELRQAHQHLSTAQEVARLGTYIFDVAAGKWNSSALLNEILGIDGAYDRSVSGWLPLVHASMRDELRRYLFDEVLAKRGRFDREFRIVQQGTGTERWVHCLGEFEFDPQNRPLRLTGTIQDITERKELQDLRSKREWAARTIAEAAVQVRDDFLATAGHELKTPLAALLMHLQSLQRAVRSGPVADLAERLQKAVRSGARLDTLVSQLLDVSRIVAGRLSCEPEPCKLAELVREVVDRFTEAGAVASPLISIRAVSQEEFDGFWDRSGLDQVITNVVGNAIKYGRGKPIEIQLARQASCALVLVIDQGIGIDPGKLGRIFGRFERAVAAREFAGFGLGLWIARQIVESSGGKIEVESIPGRGSTFTISLPIRQARSLPGPLSSPVLFVDDDDDIREAMRNTLTAEGYEMAEAADGQAALDYLRSHPPPGVVLLDWNMAPMDASAFMVELTKEPALAGVPVVLVTADVRGQRAQSQGFAGLLRKPVDLDALFELVARYCRVGRADPTGQVAKAGEA